MSINIKGCYSVFRFLFVCSVLQTVVDNIPALIAKIAIQYFSKSE